MTCDSGTGTQVLSAIGFLIIALSNFSLLFYTFISELKVAKILFLFIEQEKDKFSYFDDSFRYNSHGRHSNIQNVRQADVIGRSFKQFLCDINIYCSLLNI